MPRDALDNQIESTRVAEVAAPLARIVALLSLCVIPAALILDPDDPGFAGVAAAAVVLCAGVAVLVQRGFVRAGAYAMVGMAFTLTTVLLLLSAGRDPVLYGMFSVAVVSAGLMLGLRAAAFTVVASVTVGGLVAFTADPNASVVPYSPLRAWVLSSIPLSFLFALLWVVMRSIRTRESELVASEARFRALANSAPDLISEIGVDGRTYYLSPSHRDQLGYEIEELQNSDPTAIVHPEDRDRIMALGGIGGNEGEEPSPNAEWRVRRSDGEYRTYEFRTGRFTAPDGTQRLVAFGRDMTRHYALQAQLVQSQRMEAVGRIAGGIAHDFNNYLTVILGSAESLQNDLPKHGPEAERIEAILGAGERSANLTRQLLAFARRQALQPRVIDLNELLASMDSLLRRVIPSNIQIDTVRAGGLGGAMIDRSQFEQVILNLAINARDAMQDGGRLTIETANAYLDAAYTATRPESREGRHVMLAVTDTGSGIAEEDVGQIFEPFYSTKGPSGGTGLGLATVHGIVKQSGGSIEVYTEPGQGTTFKIYLPRVESEADTVVAEDASIPDLRGNERVLVAEDDEGVRRLICRILSEHGYQAVEASDGEQALRLAVGDTQLCAVITDVMMPGLSGPVLAERLEGARPDLRIVFISGYTANGLVGRGIDANAALVHKPFTAPQLLGRLRSVLDAS